MIPISSAVFRGTAPWNGAGGMGGVRNESAAFHACAVCGERFRPPSAGYRYREGSRWFCRYQHMADWRKAHPKKAAPGVSLCGEWRATRDGIRARINYCRKHANVQARRLAAVLEEGDPKRIHAARETANRWKRQLADAENQLAAYDETHAGRKENGMDQGQGQAAGEGRRVSREAARPGEAAGV